MRHHRIHLARLRAEADDLAPEGSGDTSTAAASVDTSTAADSAADTEPSASEADAAAADPRDAELAELRAERDRLRAEADSARSAAPVSADAPKYKDSASIAARETQLGELIEWLYSNLDGYEGAGDDGKPVVITSADVRKKLGAAHRELSADIPRERAALAARESAVAAARREFPSHFDSKHPDSARVRAVFAEVPGLDRLPNAHRIAADILAGRGARGVRPAPSSKPAAKPPVLPTGGATPPPSAAKGAAVKLDGDGLRRGAPGSMLNLIMSTLPGA